MNSIYYFTMVDHGIKTELYKSVQKNSQALFGYARWDFL